MQNTNQTYLRFLLATEVSKIKRLPLIKELFVPLNRFERVIASLGGSSIQALKDHLTLIP